MGLRSGLCAEILTGKDKKGDAANEAVEGGKADNIFTGRTSRILPACGEERWPRSQPSALLLRRWWISL
ncbi:hypothetical protein KOW79_001279 [Hemibagrus wyckioides]|uniref:Uncharacterized protein n=1 Tax=Hemibagrus wyckioides TaxID=337641 RepID=A0A9D3SXG5_9TELE|nr:hypothetical protein KOW79_001279 [Hemibagrus wyckioides]